MVASFFIVIAIAIVLFVSFDKSAVKQSTNQSVEIPDELKPYKEPIQDLYNEIKNLYHKYNILSRTNKNKEFRIYVSHTLYISFNYNNFRVTQRLTNILEYSNNHFVFLYSKDNEYVKDVISKIAINKDELYNKAEEHIKKISNTESTEINTLKQYQYIITDRYAQAH